MASECGSTPGTCKVCHFNTENECLRGYCRLELSVISSRVAFRAAWCTTSLGAILKEGRFFVLTLGRQGASYWEERLQPRSDPPMPWRSLSTQQATKENDSPLPLKNDIPFWTSFFSSSAASKEAKKHDRKGNSSAFFSCVSPHLPTSLPWKKPRSVFRSHLLAVMEPHFIVGFQLSVMIICKRYPLRRSSLSSSTKLSQQAQSKGQEIDTPGCQATLWGLCSTISGSDILTNTSVRRCHQVVMNKSCVCILLVVLKVKGFMPHQVSSCRLIFTSCWQYARRLNITW